MSDSEWMWGLICLGFSGALIVLLYLRERAHIKCRHNHIAGKIDIVQQKVEDVKNAVEGSRQEAAQAIRERRAETGYLTAMVEGSRKDSAAAVEGVRTAMHDNAAAAALQGKKNQEESKRFQSGIFRQVAEWLKFVGKDHKDES